jgi:hypothetical protein
MQSVAERTGGNEFVRVEGVEQILESCIVGSAGRCADLAGEYVFRCLASRSRSVGLLLAPPNCTQ